MLKTLSLFLSTARKTKQTPSPEKKKKRKEEAGQVPQNVLTVIQGHLYY
jgi:hypothetical protein